MVHVYTHSFCLMKKLFFTATINTDCAYFLFLFQRISVQVLFSLCLEQRCSSVVLFSIQVMMILNLCSLLALNSVSYLYFSFMLSVIVTCNKVHAH